MGELWIAVIPDCPYCHQAHEMVSIHRCREEVYPGYPLYWMCPEINRPVFMTELSEDEE
jgi:hypothetical protein